MTTTAPTNLADRVIATLRGHEPELRRAGIRHLSLFDSVARGDVTPSSDVDLAAELDPRACIGPFALGALEQRLAALIGCHVDLLPEPVQKPRRGRTSTEIASVLSSHTSADSLAETLWNAEPSTAACC